MDFKLYLIRTIYLKYMPRKREYNLYFIQIEFEYSQYIGKNQMWAYNPQGEIIFEFLGLFYLIIQSSYGCIFIPRVYFVEQKLIIAYKININNRWGFKT